MAGEIPLTREELKGLYTINPEAVFFAIDNPDFLIESEPESSQTDSASETEFELPEPLVTLFDPPAINVSDESLKTLCNKKYELYQKAYSIESYENLLIVTEKEALNPLWILHRAGSITASKCCDVWHTDTGKKSSPSLLATIIQYSETKSNKYTRFGNDNEPAARKYFVETQNTHHENLIVNETGFKVHTEYPCINASLDGIVTCFCHDMRELEIKCAYSYQKGLVNWDEGRAFLQIEVIPLRKIIYVITKCNSKCLYVNCPKLNSLFFHLQMVESVVYMYKYLLTISFYSVKFSQKCFAASKIYCYLK